MSDANQETTDTIRAEVAQVRDALRDLRESVVLRVMHRNKLAEEVTRLERLTAELDSKAAQADRLSNPSLAGEILAEHALRMEELEQFRVRLTQSQAEAEAAKIRLPEDEGTLLRQLNDLQARAMRQTAAQVQANAPGGIGGDAEDLWTRASNKISDLTREASAREEVSTARTGAAPPPTSTHAQTAPLSADENAEKMLADLEQRLGLATTPKARQTPGSQSTAIPVRAGFLELADRPATPEPNAQKSDAPSASNMETINAQDRAIEAAPDAPDYATTPEPPAPVTDEQASPYQPERGKDTVALFETRAATFENIQTNPDRNTKPMEPTSRVRVAAIGTGGIFRGAHLPCYPDIAQAQLVALCDPDKTAQDLAYKKYQALMEAKIKLAQDADDLAAAERMERDLETIQLCDDISEVIETVRPDLVDICTQPLLHTPLAIQALEAGFHVMCEKPLSRSWLESQALMQTIERTGKFYQHNENWLFDPDYYTVKKLVDAGAIGELAIMFLTQAHGGPEGNPRFFNPDFGGGGSLLDNGIHAIGAAWFVAGLHKTPTLVKAAEPFGMSIRMPDRIIDGKYQHITVEDDAHILIRFEDRDSGAWTTAHVEGSWSEQDSPDTVYIGTTGSIKMVEEAGKRFAVVLDIKGNETRRFRSSGSNWQHWPSSFYGEILNMVECVRNNQQSIMTAQFGADCSAIVGASYLSQKSGKRAVTLDEFRRFALDIADRYPNDPTGANNALVDALLSAVRKP